MNTIEPQYKLECGVTSCLWRICEYTKDGDFDYGVDYDTYDDAYRALRYIMWLESCYSKPRT